MLQLYNNIKNQYIQLGGSITIGDNSFLTNDIIEIIVNGNKYDGIITRTGVKYVDTKHTHEIVPPIQNIVTSNIYNDEYTNPELFIQILDANMHKINAKLVENNETYTAINQKQLQASGTEYGSFDEIKRLISGSVTEFRTKLIQEDDYKNQKNECVMIIPMFMESAAMALHKSNFFFSLLYLQEMKNQGIMPTKVILFSRENVNSYFTFHKKNYYVVMCDDGIYTGMQLDKTIKYVNDNFGEFIKTMFICAPFCINKKYENTGMNTKKLLNIFNTAYTITEKLKLQEEIKLYKKALDMCETKQDLTKIKRDIKNVDSSTFNKLISYPSRYSGFLTYAEQEILYQYKTDIEKELLASAYNETIIFLRVLCVGDSKYNAGKNHFFQHKIPDEHSFILTDKALRNQIDVISPVYKIDWAVNGIIVPSDYNTLDKLCKSRDINSLLFKPQFYGLLSVPSIKDIGELFTE